MKKTTDNISYAGFQIEDAGIGVTEDQLEHVFERFWRADNSGNVPGTGLGMSISKEIIRMMGGTIEIASQIGSGSKMIVWLIQTFPRKKVCFD